MLMQALRSQHPPSPLHKGEKKTPCTLWSKNPQLITQNSNRHDQKRTYPENYSPAGDHSHRHRHHFGHHLVHKFDAIGQNVAKSAIRHICPSLYIIRYIKQAEDRRQTGSGPQKNAPQRPVSMILNFFSKKTSECFGDSKKSSTFAPAIEKQTSVTKTNAEIAQLVEHNLAKVRVASSSLVFRSLIETTLMRK